MAARQLVSETTIHSATAAALELRLGPRRANIALSEESGDEGGGKQASPRRTAASATRLCTEISVAGKRSTTERNNGISAGGLIGPEHLCQGGPSTLAHLCSSANSVHEPTSGSCNPLRKGGKRGKLAHSFLYGGGTQTVSRQHQQRLGIASRFQQLNLLTKTSLCTAAGVQRLLTSRKNSC